jgi:large subunit ribosomal protein L15
LARKYRKARKMRGSRTCGYGRVGQHRKHGGKGGHGLAGLHKHKWSYAIKYMPDHFGKHGFVRHVPGAGERSYINVGDLEDILNSITKQKKLKEGEAQTIDLVELGFDKLLGSGRISRPVTVRVRSVSELAKTKIQNAGGQIITP